ncbi:MAG: toll/interleukin-1 receptor domain-containing protein [Pseudomonadota bacterium]
MTGSAKEQQARVFISYSRRDISIVEPLRNALREAGFDAYLDLHDISPGEDWKDRLGTLIASAEKVVFLISPDSVASDICAWEVDEAERQGKSILPVVVAETEAHSIPGRLARLNFIFYRFNKALTRDRMSCNPVTQTITQFAIQNVYNNQKKHLKPMIYRICTK